MVRRHEHSSAAKPLARTTRTSADASGEHREPWITKRELAEHLGISTRWIDRRIQMGLPSTLLGNRRRFQLSAVEAWLRTHHG
jgi:excisionase family DNA binding protein